MTTNLNAALAAMKLLGPEEMLILIDAAQKEMADDISKGMAQAMEMLEPMPLPNLYSFENIEAVSDDVQLHLENQRNQERNKALGI